MLSAEDLDDYIRISRSYEEARGSVDNDAAISPTASTFSSLGFGGDAASSATSYTPDPHAVSRAEAQSYYAGLHSAPMWSAPKPVGDLEPLFDVVSPLTPALGLRISTKARPNAQGTMAFYLAEGGDSDRLLGLSCRHVLIGSREANVDYVRHPSRPVKDVLLLGRRGFTDLADSIKLRIRQHGITVKRWRTQIEGFQKRENGTDAVDVEEAKAARIETQGLLDKVGKTMEALGVLLNQVNKDWKKLDNRVLGHVLRSPAITLGVDEHRFTEDWGVFQVNRAKLGDGFQGNKMDLGAF